MRFLIVFFSSVLLFLISIKKISAQNVEDKKQIEQYLTQLNNQEFEEDGYEEKYYDGKVLYSSDSLLKTFTFNGDAYFAYFTTISKSYLHILNKKKQTLKVIDVDFNRVKNIYNLSENEKETNYLILEKNEVKISSVNYVSSSSAKWLVIDTETLSMKFNQIDKKNDKRLTFSTELYDLDYTLSSDVFYNKETNLLIFEYDILDELEKKNDMTPSKFMRIMYEWKNGIFILIKEEKIAYQD